MVDVWHYAVGPFGPNQKAKMSPKGLQKAPKNKKSAFFYISDAPVGLNFPHKASIGCVFIEGVWHNHLPPFGPNQKAKSGTRGPQRTPEVFKMHLKQQKSYFFNHSDAPVGLNGPCKASIGCVFIEGVWHNHLPPFGPNQMAKRGTRGPQRTPKTAKICLF